MRSSARRLLGARETDDADQASCSSLNLLADVVGAAVEAEIGAIGLRRQRQPSITERPPGSAGEAAKV